jgi:hypothetical protein
MDATEGVQSFNFEVGQKLISHLRNLRANLNITKMQNVYKYTERVVAKLSQRQQNKQLQTMIWL